MKRAAPEKSCITNNGFNASKLLGKGEFLLWIVCSETFKKRAWRSSVENKVKMGQLDRDESNFFHPNWVFLGLFFFVKSTSKVNSSLSFPLIYQNFIVFSISPRATTHFAFIFRQNIKNNRRLLELCSDLWKANSVQKPRAWPIRNEQFWLFDQSELTIFPSLFLAFVHREPM